MTTGERLLDWRLSQNLSQRQAAEMAGVSQAQWHAYETGGKPGIDAAIRIETATSSKIRILDWQDTEEERAERRARSATRRVRRSPSPASR